MGALPGGDCDKLQIKMVLDSAAHALVTETRIQDSITSVTPQGDVPRFRGCPLSLPLKMR